MLNTSVMKRNGAGEFRGTIQKSLIPDLTHPSCVNKNECCFAVVNDREHFINQLNSQMSRPGKFFDLIRKDGFYFYSLLHFSCNDHTLGRERCKQYFSCLVEIANGR